MEPLYEAVSHLMDCDVATVTDGERNDVALRLSAARHCMKMAKELADACELHLTTEMKKDESFVLNGVGRVRRKVKQSVRAKEGGTDTFRKDLVVLVGQEVGRDLFTGEIDHTKRDAAVEAVRTVVSYLNLYPGSLSARGKRTFAIDSYTELSWVPYIEIEEGLADEM